MASSFHVEHQHQHHQQQAVSPVSNDNCRHDVRDKDAHQQQQQQQADAGKSSSRILTRKNTPALLDTNALVPRKVLSRSAVVREDTEENQEESVSECKIEKPDDHTTSNAGAASDLQSSSRRLSSRSIKRRKFDDELVESSLSKTEKPRIKLTAEPKVNETSTSAATLPGIVAEPRKREKQTSKKTARKYKVVSAAVRKDFGRWKAPDDLLLIVSVQQTCDLFAVYLGCKFSCQFTLKEIQERWHALLYDPVVSKLAVAAIKQLHPDTVHAVEAKALFSQDEEDLLASINSTTQPAQSLEACEQLLLSHPASFHAGRTAKVLQKHWALMKHHHLLQDQIACPAPKSEQVMNFNEAEDLLKDEELHGARDEEIEKELATADRRHKVEIKQLEQEIPRWQVLVESVTGINPPDFDNQTLAVLRGRLVRYLMRSREITLGRKTKDNHVDVDLSLEGPANKISRYTGLIRMRSPGEFYIINEGKRPIFVDSRPVLPGNRHKLHNNAVLEMSCLRFIFLVNEELIATFKTRAESAAKISQ